MAQRKFLKTCLSSLKISFSLLLIIVLLDIFISRSFYHPLTYFYNFLSWLSCKNFSSPNCQSTPILITSGKNGGVVTTQQKASEVGIKILASSGNAIDAAVAIGYALAVTDPCCGNIGGGGFMLIHLADGKDIFINFREKAPLAAHSDMYLDKQGKVSSKLSTKGYLAVGVPGTVKGLNYALSQYGTMSRQQIMAPAIELAEKGFVLQQGDIQILQAGRNKFKHYNISNIFLKNGKTSYQVGDRLIQKNLAQTLKLLANEGDKAFYKGKIAQKIVKASQENGGILSLKDFADYTVSHQEPIRCNYRGYAILSAPPPGGGITLCQMLNILEKYNLKNLGFYSAESLHLMLSAMLYAYADRNTYLGDPNFVKIPVKKLLSQAYTNQIQRQISSTNRAISPQPLYQNILQEGTNTTHYSVIDKKGNAVAVTYTINSYFGAGVIASDTGFFLNNEMDDFTSKPGFPNQFGLVQGKANIIEPGKRPLSSMSPTIVTKNGRVFLVTGSPGGSTIPTTILQVIINKIDYQMNLEQAVNSPRIHYQGLPNIVLTEPYALKPQVVQNLWERGYKVFPFISWGAAESIEVDLNTGTFYGVNDSRKSAGRAIAY